MVLDGNASGPQRGGPAGFDFVRWRGSAGAERVLALRRRPLGPLVERPLKRTKAMRVRYLGFHFFFEFDRDPLKCLTVPMGDLGCC